MNLVSLVGKFASLFDRSNPTPAALQDVCRSKKTAVKPIVAEKTYRLSDGEIISEKEMTELIARFRENHAYVRKTVRSGKAYGAWLDTHFHLLGSDFVRELRARGGY